MTRAIRSLQPGLLMIAAVAASITACKKDELPTGPNNGTGSVFISPITPSLSIPAGGLDSVIFLISRVDYSGTLSLALTNGPQGVTATFNPSPVPGSGIQTYVRVSVAASVAPASYTLTVTATYSGKTTSGNVVLVVTPGTQAGNVTLDLAGCLSLNQVLWVAGQDGTGAWTRLTGANQLYRFNVLSGKGGIAWVLSASNAASTHVLYGTQAELTAAPIVPCTAVASKC